MAGTGDKLPTVMKAVRLHKFGGPEVLQLDMDVPLPTCGAKEVSDVEFFHLASLHYLATSLCIAYVVCCYSCKKERKRKGRVFI